MITQDLLLQLFEYKDGKLYHKINHKNAKKGTEVKTKSSHGYTVVTINGKQYRVHRIVWAMHYDNLPEFLDHIDGNKNNNQIFNLRPVTKQQNQYNYKRPSSNTSGVKNVCFDRASNKWRVRLKVNKKLMSFGQYSDLDAAELVATLAREKYHGSFANHGL